MNTTTASYEGHGPSGVLSPSLFDESVSQFHSTNHHLVLEGSSCLVQRTTLCRPCWHLYWAPDHSTLGVLTVSTLAVRRFGMMGEPGSPTARVCPLQKVMEMEDSMPNSYTARRQCPGLNKAPTAGQRPEATSATAYGSNGTGPLPVILPIESPDTR